jgi:hypothetical protein
MVTSMGEVFDEINNKGAIDYDSDSEHIADIKELVLAFAEMVVEPLFTNDTLWWDCLYILSIFDYLKRDFEHQYGLNPIFPKPRDIREYIKNKRKQIIKNIKNDQQKRTDIKARVNKDGFKRLKQGEYLTPFAAFSFA